jgi:hypothetical protein
MGNKLGALWDKLSGKEHRQERKKQAAQRSLHDKREALGFAPLGPEAFKKRPPSPPGSLEKLKSRTDQVAVEFQKVLGSVFVDDPEMAEIAAEMALRFGPPAKSAKS